MKIVSYLTEPASYTIDLVSKVHKPLGVDYRFLQRKTLAKTDHFLEDSVYMQDKSWLDRVLFIKRDY